MDADTDHLTWAYAENARTDIMVYTLLLLFFLHCFWHLLKLCRQIPSPIHIIALSQALLGVIASAICTLYAFLIVTCSVTLWISMVSIGVGCILLTLVISIQVFYIYPKNLPMRILLSVYFISYGGFITYIGITQEPVHEPVHCVFSFPTAIPLGKLFIDLFGNLVLGGAIVKGIRMIALKEGGTFWHRMIVERVYHIVIILLVNTITAIVIVMNIAKDKGYFLYFVDWVAPCAILTYHLRNAHDRREQRRRGELTGRVARGPTRYTDTMLLTDV